MTEYRLWDLWANDWVLGPVYDRSEIDRLADSLSEGKGEAGGIRIMTREVTEWSPVE